MAPSSARRHRVRDGTLDRPAYAARTTGPAGAEPPTRHPRRNLLAIEPGLWTFAASAGIEPTNNGAERGLRRAGLRHRHTRAYRSTGAIRFAEHILAAVSTFRQQVRDVLDYRTGRDTCTPRTRLVAP